MVKSGETATFTYNADGLRVKKVCTTTGTTHYTLHGKNVVHLSNGSNNLHFFYDAQNRPAVVVFNGTAYGYVHNLQGDIIAIVNSDGTIVVEYAYDAWGKPINKTGSLASTLGTLNPFRYRGYIYDEEMALYYLYNRYYDPAFGRFVNLDNWVCQSTSFLSHNLYSYCTNELVSLFDPSGHVGILSVLMLCAGGWIIADVYIAGISDLNPQEKDVSRQNLLHTADAYFASMKASFLVDKYWGDGADDVDVTRANACKHAVWNAIMARDLGAEAAEAYATAHESTALNNHTIYEVGKTSVVTTLAASAEMDMVNNARGRYIGAQLPWHYTMWQISDAVLSDMLLHPDEYVWLEEDVYSEPIRKPQ